MNKRPPKSILPCLVVFYACVSQSFMCVQSCVSFICTYIERFFYVFVISSRSLGTPVNSLTRNGPYGKLQSPLEIARDSSIPWLLRMNEWITHMTEIECSRMQFNSPHLIRCQVKFKINKIIEILKYLSLYI